MAISRSQNALATAGQALAMSGAPEAVKIIAELEERFPAFTLIKAVSIPTIRSAIELQQGNTAKAIEALRFAVPYEGALLGAIYTRGQAYLKAKAGLEAAAEFKKVLDHRAVAPTLPLYPLAHLGLARARVLAGDAAGARKSYQDFLAIWKNADPDIPILIQAKQEYAKLN